MMTKKGIVLCSLITILSGVFLFFSFMLEEKNTEADSIYQVYLDGEKIGLISSKEELYSLINKEQIEIKDEYKVDQVYPPKGFQIVKKNTYEDDLSTVEDIYNSIKDEKEFTIKGYTVTIKSPTEGVEPIYIYVLDQNVFKEALNNVVKTFVGEERYKQYLTKTQPEIVDTGYVITNMYFQDKIFVKESYVSVAEKIYTDSEELTKYLLFGNNDSRVDYTVVQGDTIEKIAESHMLNTSELLIANENIKSEDTLLAIGQTVNVALINPVLTFIYDATVVEDVGEQFQKIVEYDPNQYVGYSQLKQEGISGINRVTSLVQYINGEQNQGVKVLDTQVLRPVQNEITVKGTKARQVEVPYPSNRGYVDNNQPWAWPTNTPYVITSGFAYRWGSLHEGIDISGTGYGSPIYASLDGVVVSAQYGGMVGSAAGLNVVILHANGYYTVYAHCSKVYVSVGQQVARAQIIAAMGHTGVAYGTHLHFGVYVGKPYNGGYPINPLRLWS